MAPEVAEQTTAAGTWPVNVWQILTPREAQVARLIAQGHGRESTAHRMGITLATVRNMLHAIFGKLGVSDQLGMVRALFTLTEK